MRKRGGLEPATKWAGPRGTNKVRAWSKSKWASENKEWEILWKELQKKRATKDSSWDSWQSMLSFICCATHFPICLGVKRCCSFTARLWFTLQRHAALHTYTFNSLWNFTSFHVRLIVQSSEFSFAISGQGFPAAITAKSLQRGCWGGHSL